MQLCPFFFTHRFQQFLHFLLRHSRRADAVAYHPGERTVVVRFQQFREFFLYLFEDDWRRLKTFDGSRASLVTWMSVTSFRFFKSYKHSKIDSNGLISISDKWETFVGDWVQSSDAGLMMDLNKSINSIKNERDREIAKLIFIQDKEFQVVADRFGLTIDYVYTVKNRLVKQLKSKLDSYR